MLYRIAAICFEIGITASMVVRNFNGNYAARSARLPFTGPRAGLPPIHALRHFHSIHSPTHRKTSSSEIWHLCSNCSHRPSLTFVLLTALTDGAQVCGECIAKRRRREVPGVRVRKEIDSESRLWSWHNTASKAIAPVRVISLCRLRQEKLNF